MQINTTVFIHANAQEFGTNIRAQPVKIGAQIERARRDIGDTLQAQNEGANHDQEGHNGRYRIARQTNEPSLATIPAHLAKGQRFARLDGDFPHIELPFGFDSRFDVIFLTDRNATTGDDQIVITGRTTQGIAS